MAEKKKYNSILISGRKNQTLTYSKYVKDDESGESVKESLDKKVNVTDELTTQQIKNGAITNEKMAAGSVGNTNLQDGSVSNEKLEDGSITNEKLAENSITKDKLKDNTIGVEKLDPELRQTINAATGLPENLVETIQNVDDTLADHQSQLNDIQSQIDDKQQQITANDEDISLLQTRSTQMEETIKSISATGGASQATAVTYNNEKSGLTAVNAQAAIDEVDSKLRDLSSDTKDIKYLQYTESRFINYNDGAIIDASPTTQWQTTDKFRVAVGAKIVYRFEGLATNAAFIAAYDKQGNYLKNKSVQGGTTFVEGTYIVEEGVYYIAICHYEEYSGTIQPFIHSQIEGIENEISDTNNNIRNLSSIVANDIKSLKTLSFVGERYIQYADGNNVNASGTSWSATDRIRVVAGVTIKYSFTNTAENVAVIAAYDKDLNYIQNKSVKGSANSVSGTYIVDADVYYIRISRYEIYEGTIQPFFQAQINNIVSDLGDNLLYKSFVRKPMLFTSKRALFTGDSITYGFTSGLTNTHGIGDYPKLLSEKLNMDYVNAGVAGTTITQTQYGTIKTQIENGVSGNYDYLFIAGGINDWQLGISLQDFRAAVKDYCTYINENYPISTQVIWITPINHAGYKIDRNVIPQRQNETTVNQYRNIISEEVLANDKFNRFSLIQGTDLNFPTSKADPYFIRTAFGDKLHPSEYGYKNIYVPELISILQASDNNSICLTSEEGLSSNNDAQGEKIQVYFTSSSIDGNPIGMGVPHVGMVRVRCMEGTLYLLKCKIDGSRGNILGIELVKQIENSSSDNGTIKDIIVDVCLDANEFIAIAGKFKYGNTASSSKLRMTSTDLQFDNLQEMLDSVKSNSLKLSSFGNYCVGYALYETIDGMSKQVDRLLQERNGHIIVDASGRGDFTSLQEAIDAIGNKHATIHVKEGRYKMSAANSYNEGSQKHLNIIGENKYKCIVYNDDGFYETGENYKDTSCLKLSGDCRVEKLTIQSTSEHYSGSNDDGHKTSYCINNDFKGDDINDWLEIVDCIMYNDHSACLGLSLRNNVRVVNCEMESNIEGNSGIGTILAHVDTIANHRILEMKQCIIKGSKYGFTHNTANAWKDGNVYYYMDLRTIGNTIIAPIQFSVFNGSTEIEDLVNCLVTEFCHGNNVDKINNYPLIGKLMNDSSVVSNKEIVFTDKTGNKRTCLSSSFGDFQINLAYDMEYTISVDGYIIQDNKISIKSPTSKNINVKL